MNELHPDKTQPGKKPEETRQKSRPSLPGQRALQESLRVIGMILQSGVDISALSAEQLRLVGKTIGNTQLVRLLGGEGIGRCLPEEGAIWPPDNLLAQTGLKVNEAGAGPPETGSTLLFEAVDAAQIAPSNPFGSGGSGGQLWTG